MGFKAMFPILQAHFFFWIKTETKNNFLLTNYAHFFFFWNPNTGSCLHTIGPSCSMMFSWAHQGFQAGVYPVLSEENSLGPSACKACTLHHWPVVMFQRCNNCPLQKTPPLCFYVNHYFGHVSWLEMGKPKEVNHAVMYLSPTSVSRILLRPWTRVLQVPEEEIIFCFLLLSNYCPRNDRGPWLVNCW